MCQEEVCDLHFAKLLTDGTDELQWGLLKAPNFPWIKPILLCSKSPYSDHSQMYTVTEDNVVTREMQLDSPATNKSLVLHALLQPYQVQIIDHLGMQCKETTKRKIPQSVIVAFPASPIWDDEISGSVFAPVGSHASSFVCLLSLCKLLLVRCSHSRVPPPSAAQPRTKKTKGLCTAACSHSCDKA